MCKNLASILCTRIKKKICNLQSISKNIKLNAFLLTSQQPDEFYCFTVLGSEIGGGTPRLNHSSDSFLCQTPAKV